MKTDRITQYKQAPDQNYWWQLFKHYDIDAKTAEFKRSRLYRILVSNIKKADRVLEGGCGMGKISFSLLQDGYSVIGIDYSKKLIEKVKSQDKKFAKNFLTMDARSLKFPPSSFDVYISPGVIEHFQDSDQEKMLREAHHILKKDGRIILIVPVMNALRSLRAKQIQKEFDELKAKGVPFYQFVYSTKAVKKLLEKTGFEPIALEKLGLHDTRIFGKKVFPRFLHNNRFLLFFFATTVCVIAKKAEAQSKSS